MSAVVAVPYVFISVKHLQLLFTLGFHGSKPPIMYIYHFTSIHCMSNTTRMSGKIWPVRVRIPKHLVRGFWEHAGGSTPHLKLVLTAAYLERVKEVSLIEAKRKKSDPDRMQYCGGVDL